MREGRVKEIRRENRKGHWCSYSGQRSSQSFSFITCSLLFLTTCCPLVSTQSHAMGTIPETSANQSMQSFFLANHNPYTRKDPLYWLNANQPFAQRHIFSEQTGSVKLAVNGIKSVPRRSM